MLRVYLAGPINKSSHRWRNAVKKRLEKHKIKVLNPQDYIFTPKTDGWDYFTKLVETDLKLLTSSDIVFFNVTSITVGTSMELGYAHSMKKRLYFACDRELLHPWHLYHTKVWERYNTWKLAVDDLIHNYKTGIYKHLLPESDIVK